MICILMSMKVMISCMFSKWLGRTGLPSSHSCWELGENDGQIYNGVSTSRRSFLHAIQLTAVNCQVCVRWLSLCESHSCWTHNVINKEASLLNILKLIYALGNLKNSLAHYTFAMPTTVLIKNYNVLNYLLMFWVDYWFDYWNVIFSINMFTFKKNLMIDNGLT